MATIPKPNKARIKLLHGGVNHISSYTKTSLGRISYGTRRVWDVTYTWTVISRETAEQLYPALYTLGAGQGTIPLYFDIRSGHVSRSRLVGDLSGVRIEKRGTNLIMDSSEISAFGFKPFDRIQVGDYCLEITGVSGNNLTIANMPENLNIGNDVNIRNYDYYMIGQNLSEDIGYESIGSIGENIYNPEVINFREVIL